MTTYVRKVRLTDRDKRIINFVSNVGICNTNTIYALFYEGVSLRNCQLRLSKLVEGKQLKRWRNEINSQYYYYIGIKPKQYLHKSLFGSTLAYLKSNGYQVTEYQTPCKLANIISDGVILANGKYYLIEVELSKYLDVDKYNKFYFSRGYKELCNYMPSIIVVSDKKIPNGLNRNIKVIHYTINQVLNKGL